MHRQRRQVRGVNNYFVYIVSVSKALDGVIRSTWCAAHVAVENVVATLCSCMYERKKERGGGGGVRKREGGRERLCVCVQERVCVCVCVCV